MDDSRKDELRRIAGVVVGLSRGCVMASLDEVDTLARGVLALLEENERLRRDAAGSRKDGLRDADAIAWRVADQLRSGEMTAEGAGAVEAAEAIEKAAGKAP